MLNKFDGGVGGLSLEECAASGLGVACVPRVLTPLCPELRGQPPSEAGITDASGDHPDFDITRANKNEVRRPCSQQPPPLHSAVATIVLQPP